MTPTKSKEVLSWVTPKIEKLCVRRRPVGLEQRFCETLCYLVTGDAHVAITASYRIIPTSISRMIRETTGGFWDVLLKKQFLQPPQT